MSAPDFRCTNCWGTGRNKTGGPCQTCRGTGRVGKVAAGFQAVTGLFALLIALAVVVVILATVVFR